MNQKDSQSQVTTRSPERPSRRTRPTPSFPGSPERGPAGGPRALPELPHGGRVLTEGALGLRATALTPAPSVRTAPSGSSSVYETIIGEHDTAGGARLPGGRVTVLGKQQVAGTRLGGDAGADSRGSLAVSVRASLRDTAGSCLQLLASNLHQGPVAMRCHSLARPWTRPLPHRQVGSLSRPGNGPPQPGRTKALELLAQAASER